MNRIKHDDIDSDAFINKLPLSHIQNVRHCSNKTNKPSLGDPPDCINKNIIGEKEPKNQLKSGNSTSFSESISDKTTTNKSKNASIQKGFKTKEVHPLSLMVDNRFQRTSLLPDLFNLKYKYERKTSKESNFNDNLDMIKHEQSSLKKFKTSKIIISPRAFLLKEIPENEVTRFKIIRESNILLNKLTMYLQGEREVKIDCQKIFKILGTQVSFKIDDSCNKKQKHQQIIVVQPEIGWVQSCFDGSIFNVYEKSFNNRDSQMIATIEYFKDTGEDGRHYGVKIYYRNKKAQSLPTNVAEQNFKIFHVKNPFDQSVQCLESFIPLTESSSNIDDNGLDILVMNGKKKSLPSIHNIIFVDKHERPLIKFYKIEDGQYFLQCFGPISSFIGCAYAYSSFVFKLISK